MNKYFLIVGIILGLLYLVYTPQFDGLQLKGVSDNIHHICYPIK